MAAETEFLDRGDGTCRHYNELKKECGIYTDRPDICRVDRQYALNYAHLYDWDKFVVMNLHVCEQLQNHYNESRPIKFIDV